VEMTQSGGLGLGFKTLPYLFEQWGPTLAVICGVFWFGLLFFAGITSSLAMGTPCMGFMMDEFKWKRERSAWAFGAAILVLGLPTVLFFNEGVFDEYDYWAGTVSLVVFAMVEIILFAWVFGMDKGWKEINAGSDMKVPTVFRFIIKYITPVILLYVFISNIPGIVNKISNSDIKTQLAAATDETVITQLNEQMFYGNVARIILLLVWLGVAYLVYVAYKKRMREGRFTS